MALRNIYYLCLKLLSDLIVKTVSNLEDVKKEEEAKAAMKAHDSIVNQYKDLIREQVEF